MSVAYGLNLFSRFALRAFGRRPPVRAGYAPVAAVAVAITWAANLLEIIA
ncbi:hypothetical protein Poly30_17490 [Planctomycetes bacterium Poly30]|uniref:Uncharacterized protein n=1 Tax=Saltatorellus ferox TaxID=2528018 RepID=A0A518EQ78_9BACT|nr:hypothetical protein Poly30_17490 [Planctomycetes bacterium Poly30]